MEPSVFDFVIAGAVSGSLIAAGHYLPWRTWIGRELPRLAAYAWGVASIFAGFALVASAWAIALFIVAAGSAGFVTVLAWLVDWALHERQRRLIAEGTVNAVERLGS
jgi:hypothetical protein